MTNLPIRIAIADDHKLFRQGIIQLLKRSDRFQIIIEAENCQQLLEALEKELPDIILMDLEMPDMDGMEGCKILLERFPSLKVIVLSMHSADNFIFHMMKSGARSYLPKDIDQDNLRLSIEEVMDKGYHFTEEVNRAMLRGIRTGTRQKLHFKNIQNPLSRREKEVLELLCKGLTTNEIADQLSISHRTVEGHRQNLLDKTGTNNSVSLAVYTIRNGLLDIS